MSQFRLPSNSQRLFIVGKTGSGKTRGAMWHLSQRDFYNECWVIIDFKGEQMFADPRLNAVYLDIEERPERNGLFVYKVSESQINEVNDLLWWVYRNGNIGVYVDEGYMIPAQGEQSKALRSLLTQGRSLNIPIILLSQRPVWCSKFAISEADFIQSYFLLTKDDRKMVGDFLGGMDLESYMTTKNVSKRRKLKDFHSLYYDVAKDLIFALPPVPNDDAIINAFDVPKQNKKVL